MKFGAVFPTCEIGNDPIAVRDFAQTAEALGYSHIIAYDHVLGAVHEDREPPLGGPYTEKDDYHEPLITLTYMAAATTTIEFMTGVLILPQRQTALVAKQVAEIDYLSSGRFRLGVGTGWNYVEYESLGTKYADRGRRLDEQVDVLQELWSEPVLDYTGEYHRIDRAGIKPLPKNRIPLWFGGFSPPALRRAVAKGDGFLFGSSAPIMQGLCQQLTDLLDKAGRDRGSFGIDALMGYGNGPNDGWGQMVETWEQLGATHFSMRAMSTGAKFTGDIDPGFTTPQQHIDALETFMKEVG